jgi:hypothetical protein
MLEKAITSIFKGFHRNFNKPTGTITGRQLTREHAGLKATLRYRSQATGNIIELNGTIDTKIFLGPEKLDGIFVFRGSRSVDNFYKVYQERAIADTDIIDILS